MSIATITRTAYTSPTSQATFLSMLDTAMGVAGFTLYDSKNITTVENRIYSLTVSASAKGIVYLRMFLTTAMSITSRLSSAWNTSTNTASDEGGSTTATGFSLTSLETINFIAINSAELKGVLITQGTASFLLGVIRPANIENWYDESQFNMAINADNTNNAAMRGTTLIPGGSGNAWGTNLHSLLSNVNPFAGNTRQIKPIEFLNPSGYGTVAHTSSDLVYCAPNGITGTGIAELVTSTATYLYLGKNSSLSSALAVRIA
ncbi:MAG: hypothetical protein KME52_31855 [Desmonostoc geniculatum HA4340-LM1]|jgi:hypothetical protein|nr:hypothetical protein [Desmonostoc geniculatum HA4340-LM1]